jgi:hypothetical protein
LEFVLHLNYEIIELKHFGSCNLLPSSGKKEEKGTDNLSVGAP